MKRKAAEGVLSPQATTKQSRGEAEAVISPPPTTNTTSLVTPAPTEIEVSGFIIQEFVDGLRSTADVKDEEASEGAISTAVAMEDEKGCAEAIMKVNEALAMQLQRELSGLRPR